MPRLPTSLLLHARHIDPILPILLRSCRDITSARNELRWLREHVKDLPKNGRRPGPLTLAKLCLERSRGKPLQYILGNQPFGDLDILCRPGVLIPRLVSPSLTLTQKNANSDSPETEAYTTFLAQLIGENISKLSTAYPGGCGHRLRVLDLCTGTGCITLLSHAMLSPYIRDLTIMGIDISPGAVSLARQNLDWNVREGHLHPVAREQVTFEQGDVFNKSSPVNGQWDVVISNPPYISPQGFNKDTIRSVRNYEPKLALVPPARVQSQQPVPDHVHGDMFYPKLLEIASNVEAKLVLMEVDGRSQALRVRQMIHDMRAWDGCEFWMDEPGNRKSSGIYDTEGNENKPRLIGLGHERSVVCWRQEGQTWLGWD